MYLCGSKRVPKLSHSHCSIVFLQPLELYSETLFASKYDVNERYIQTCAKKYVEICFTQRSSSSSMLVEHAALGISAVSSLRANLPRMRGRLSASVFRHAYWCQVPTQEHHTSQN